jgi:putative RNA 2'-phosphotransferase
MDKHGLKKLHKILIAMLARQPDLYGLFPDKNGWIKIRELHGALAQESEFPHMTMASLMQFFNIFGHETFETNGLYVRVKNQEELPLPETATPPEILYLPIRPKAYERVAMDGFIPPQGKEWVILATTRELAVKIGKRRDNTPIISEVMSLDAERCGTVFKKFGENLFLAGALKPEYLKLPPLPKNRQKNKKDTTISPRAPGELADIGGYILGLQPEISVQASQSPIFDDKKKKKRFRDKEPTWKQTRHIQKRK